MTSHGGVSTAIRPKVLVVDDDKSTREVIGLRLEARGYQPLLAPDPESARKYVEAHIVNLAIVDIRLQDAANQEDRSGLDFARELMRKLVPGLPVIILTAFPDPDKVNEELQHALKNDLPLQVVAKQDLSRWLEAVDWATRKSPINVGPRTNRDRLKKLIQRLESARKRGEKRLTALDMEELLRRLFLYQDTTLYLRELLPGRSGSGILLVEPNYEGVSGARLVVKYGERRSIETEATNYQRFVEPYILPSATVQIGPPVYTSDWGAMKYVFLGASAVVPEDFASYFERQQVRPDQLRNTVRAVFATCCRGWYRGVRLPASDENDLRKSYSAVLDLNKAERQQRIDEAVQQVFAGRRRQPVKFLRRPSGIEVCSGQHNEVLPDPVEYFRDLRSRFPPPSLIAITHGDLNASNILVDAQGHPWLIDFFRTGWGHALRDAAELESVTKFELLDHGESLMNILAFEAALIKSPSLNHIRIPGQLSGIFNRPLAVLREVRKQAASVSGDPEAMMEYRAALFLYAIKELSRHPTSDDPALLYSRRAHVLYSAALIARFLQY